jgi:hypothetical protein
MNNSSSLLGEAKEVRMKSEIVLMGLLGQHHMTCEMGVQLDKSETLSHGSFLFFVRALERMKISL